MLFVRGIKGKLKLNPAVKLWGGILLLLIIIAGGLAYRFIQFRETVLACEEHGGVWIGGALLSASCAPDGERDNRW